MRSHRTSFTIICIAMWFAATVSAEPVRSGQTEVIEAAELYLAAYTELDISTLTRLYADDVTFIDPTSQHVAEIAVPVQYEGKESVLAFISSLEGLVLDARYDVERVYEASGQVVFIGEAVFTFSAEPVPYRYRAEIVTIVSIENGLVSEHRDYVDYSGLKLEGE